jgi:hypothetical protein
MSVVTGHLIQRCAACIASSGVAQQGQDWAVNCMVISAVYVAVFVVMAGVEPVKVEMPDAYRSH